MGFVRDLGRGDRGGASWRSSLPLSWSPASPDQSGYKSWQCGMLVKRVGRL